MWISEIELICFKSYQHQVFTFPMPEKDKNLVIIGGLNGYGKTSILEALYLCLYGKDAMVYLARAGLKTDESKGYPTFLERAFNSEALREKRDTMMAKVVINKTRTKAIEVKRKWYFRPNGFWTGEEEAVVREILRGVPGIPKIDGKNNFHLFDVIDDFFVPAHIAPFFFFDGEEVKKLADQGRVEQVKQGLEGLLGVVLLRSLAERLKTFEAQKRSGVLSVDEDRLNILYDELNSNQQKLKELDNQIINADEEQARLRGELQSIIERVTTAGGGSCDIATVKDLVEEREQFRNKLKSSQKKLEEMLAGRLPFHLVSGDLFDSFCEQIKGEIRYFTWESDKRSLEPRKVEFENAFLNQTEPEVVPELTTEQLSCIRNRIETAWACLFYPPPDDCAKEIVHEYMNESIRNDVLKFISSISLSSHEFQDLINEQNTLAHRIDELGRKVSILEGIDRDGTLTGLKDSLKKVQDRMDDINENSRVDERTKIALEAKISSQKAEYERERKKLDEFSPVRNIIEKSERVRKVIDAVIPNLFPLKIKQLAKAMTAVYKQLAHKDLVSKIEINDDGNTHILSKSGKEIQFDRSAGENQLFATALIAGLAKVSGVKAPMVVDTPLGRLDSMHRKNILTFWAEDKNRQVILLSQDEEIDPKYFKQIKNSVSKTYLLEHTDVGDGIGRTTAIENAYFMGNN